MTLVGGQREIDGKVNSLRVGIARDNHCITLKRLQLGPKLDQAI